MVFALKADIAFTADDLDDAFVELATHFLKLRCGDDSNLIELGSIDILPLNPQTSEDA